MAREEHPIGLAVGVCVIAIWLNMGWLAWLMGIAAALMVLSTIRIHHTPCEFPGAAAGPPEKEEVLTPVVVQDVGEPPYLYPPTFRLKIKTPWHSWGWWEEVARCAGLGARALLRAGMPKDAAGVRRRMKRYPAANWRGPY